MKKDRVIEPTIESVAEQMAQDISKISEAMQKLSRSRLTRDAIITLIARSSGVSRIHIETVLRNLGDLEKRWLKPESSKETTK